jgi:hypothetical protein
MIRPGTASGTLLHRVQQVQFREQRDLTALEAAIVRTVGYGDVFDYPLTLEEIHQNLIGLAADEPAVHHALNGPGLVPGYLHRNGGHFTLAGRANLVDIRRERLASSATLWARAHYYGRLIARIPFVRLVAVTGALAVGNARPGDDIDYLIVTEPGRLWLCRALIIVLVKQAARRGDVICPNYFLTERALALPEHDLFTAHELLQMVPLYGFDVYRRMLALNVWAGALLPNAFTQRTRGVPAAIDEGGRFRLPKALLERALRSGPGGWLERWEMNRKVARFNRQMRQPASVQPREQPPQELIEVLFSQDRCKGHFDQHGRRTLEAYSTLMAFVALSAEHSSDGELPAADHLFPGHLVGSKEE